MDTPGTLTINGRQIAIDDLTLDEVDVIEDTCGAALEDLDLRRARVLKVIVWTMLRRDDPDITLDQVGAIKVTDLAAGGNGNGAAG